MGLSFVSATQSSSPVSVQQGGVTLRDVSKQFGQFTAVEQINLQIDPGSYTCLLGPSGCGKTTTLRLIAGHESASSGEVWIGTEQVNDRPAAQRDTAMVFQNYALFPHKSVQDNIGFGLKMKGVSKTERKQRISEMLALVDLDEFAKRKPFQLSGGQQQRVALARALVTRPQVVLLDEPLSALDESLRARTRMELRKLQQQFGMTFIQVTHSQDEAFSLSDRVVVMDRGRIDQVGTPVDIFNRPASQFVARFVGDNNILPGEVESITQQAESSEIVLNVPGIGRVVCQGDASHISEQPACCIRGDRLQIVNSASHHSSLPNQLTARICSVEFTGFVSRVSLVNERDGRDLLFKVRTDDWLKSGYQEGQTIGLGWTVEDCVFLPH
ncbi:MAG: ABC transporter ATP-binding protein [Synechococcus sp.]